MFSSMTLAILAQEEAESIFQRLSGAAGDE